VSLPQAPSGGARTTFRRRLVIDDAAHDLSEIGGIAWSEGERGDICSGELSEPAGSCDCEWGTEGCALECHETKGFVHTRHDKGVRLTE
jgi:hypothetical protein